MTSAARTSNQPIAADAGTHSVSRFALWFGLLGGAFAWTVHLMGAYGIAEFGCVSDMHELRFWNLSAVAWLLLAVSVATFAVAVAATVVAYRCGVQLRTRLAEVETESNPRAYVAIVGALTSGLFALSIAVESVPIFYYLHDC